MATHCDDCTTGTFLASAPDVGSVVSLTSDTSAYVVRGGDAAKARAAIVLCTDIFGWELPNVRVLAQQLSEATGADVFVPDIIGGGDSCAAEGYDFKNLPEWFSRHGDAETVPRVTAAITAIKASHGKARVMTLGFCWGARYALLAASGSRAVADAWGVAHPTKTAPSDYADAANSSGAPGLFLLAETDGMFPAAKVAETRELLAGKPEYVFEGPWPGTNHGFVVRGDDGVAAVAEARAAARAAAAKFFAKMLARWAEEEAHGHSHGGPDGGHSHAAAPSGGHSHAGGGGHSHGGHSHGGQECSGHGHGGGSSGCNTM